MLKTVGFPSTRTGDQTIVNGNLVIGTAGKGIDFSAATHAAGMTSELLNDYEVGTFTPVVSSASGTVTNVDNSNRGYYVKVGNLVYITLYTGISTDASVGTSDLTIAGLPFSSLNVTIHMANFCQSNYSGGDLGTGGAAGAAWISTASLYYTNRTIDISSRGTFYWGWSGVYSVS